MKLDMDRSRFSIEEQVIEEVNLIAGPPRQTGTYWIAELDGVSEGGESVRMTRNGKTPDAALDNLFDGMTEARITL